MSAALGQAAPGPEGSVTLAPVEGLASEARAWVKSAVTGNPWRYERPREPVPIWSLVAPLRYDILIRRSFFERLAAERALYERDFDAFARAAREHPYFVWFRHVMCPSWQPEVLRDEASFDAAWRARLRAAARLADSFAEHGFDERRPITLWAGVRVLPAVPTGRRVDRDLFAGDGCHRLALLLASGHDHLLPGQARVRRFRTFTPPDTTPGLAARLGVAPEDLPLVLAGVPAATEETTT